MNIYGQRKAEDSTLARFADQLKAYTSTLGLGANIFSATNNVTVGFFQSFLKAVGGEYFTLRDLWKAHTFFMRHIGGFIQDTMSNRPRHILSLLAQRFDMSEDLYHDLQDTDMKYNGVFKQLFGIDGYTLQSLGEIYLHIIPGLARLENQKVKNGDNTISLLDSFNIIERKTQVGNSEISMYDLDLPENLIKEDGSIFNEDAFRTIYNDIHIVSHKVNGDFSDAGKGIAHRWFLGRLIMNFRQWMPAMYSDRYSREYYSIIEGKNRGGYYTAFGNDVVDMIRSKEHLKTAKIKTIMKWNNMNAAEKRLAMSHILETAIAWVLPMILAGAVPDKEHPLYNIFLLTLKRLSVDISSMAPSAASFNAITTIIKSPVAAFNVIDKVGELTNIGNMNKTIKSGRFKDWNRYAKDVFVMIPYLDQGKRFADFLEGSLDQFKIYE